MRILHLTSFLQGGAGLSIVALARSQRAAGHEVIVVTSRTAPEGYGNYAAHLQALAEGEVPVHAVDSLFYRDRALNLQALCFLKRDLNAGESFDIVHAHAAVPSRIALRLARRKGPLVVQTMHGWGIRKTPDQEADDIKVLKRVAGVVVPSRTSFDLLARFGVSPRRMSIVPYGVDPVNDPLAGIDSMDPDLEHIRHVRQAGRRVACCVGTVGERKNQRLLVEALALMPASTRPFCIFIGEGDGSTMTALAERCGIADSVRFTGHKVNARELLQASDCLVLPSRSEGLPLSVLEAFCDRVPVIASDIAELSEIVHDGDTGLLFSGGDASALATTLTHLFALPHPERWAMCRRAHEIHVREFRTSHMCDRYMRTYQSLLTTAARRAGTQCAA